ncbi:MAG: Uma2 family endonuclease [Nitrospirae bacterium]|nr:Uma2 family endonuclease [Nitrospirota bacterium]
MGTTIELEKDFDLTEIINGEEVVSPSPFGKHQKIIQKIVWELLSYLKKHDLGELYWAPFDVILEEGQARLQPDLFFIRKENMAIFQDWIRGVPDMICEIVSSGSYERDIEVKRAIYEKYRVPEYWLVIPELQTIEILTIEGDKYKVHSMASLEGVVTSKVIEGLTVNLKDIFE